MYISVKADWIKTCGAEKRSLGTLANGDHVFEVINVEEYVGRADKMYNVVVPYGDWTVWNIRGVTEYVNNPLLKDDAMTYAEFMDAAIIEYDAMMHVAADRQRQAAEHVNDAMFFLDKNMPVMAMVCQDKARMMYGQARRIMCGAEHDIDPATCGQ